MRQSVTNQSNEIINLIYNINTMAILMKIFLLLNILVIMDPLNCPHSKSLVRNREEVKAAASAANTLSSVRPKKKKQHGVGMDWFLQFSCVTRFRVGNVSPFWDVFISLLGELSAF